MNKIKVALVCHFSNQMVRDKLDLDIHLQYLDFANWISNIIDGIKKRNDVELYVIAPHKGMKHAIQEFDHENIHYFFFRSKLPFPWSSIETRLFPQEKRGYPRSRKYVKLALNKIQPDLINLVGAENPYYAISILDVENVPILIHCQTVYANPDRIKNTGNVNQQRWETELKLFHKSQYMACSGQMYFNLIKGYEPNAFVFPLKWPALKLPVVPEVEKNYDFVFFAHILSKKKGFDNAIEAMSIMANKHPEVRFLAVGSKDDCWPQYEERIKRLGLDKNLEIHPPFTKYIDMLQYVKQSRFALLPVTMDVISSTIIEAMRMGLPIVTCRTSGTPSLNETRETVLISEIGDSEGLYMNMNRLYEDSELQGKLINNGFLYCAELDKKSSQNIEEMVLQYKLVIEHYRYGRPIPKEKLFDENTIIA